MKKKILLYIYLLSVVLAIIAGVLSYIYAENYKVLITVIFVIWAFSIPASYYAWYTMLLDLPLREGVILYLIFRLSVIVIIPIFLFPYLNYKFYKDLYYNRRKFYIAN